MGSPVYDQVVSTLKSAVSANPRPSSLMRQLAAEVVALRQEFIFNGLPDWAGQSQGYRDTIYRAYREAGVPSDSAGGLQANLRYHVGNVVREVASFEDFLALGMDPEGPRARAVSARKQHARKAGRPITKAAPRNGMAAIALATQNLGSLEQLQAENLRLRERIGQLESTLDILLERMTKASTG